MRTNRHSWATPAQIAWAYGRSWFLVDLVAVLPLDLILILPGISTGSSSLLGVLRLPKVSFLSCTVTIYANLAHNLTRSP